MGDPGVVRAAPFERSARWVPLTLMLFCGAVLVLVVLAQPVSAQTPPPTSGDWVIADATTLSSQTVIVNGNLIISNGGSLNLANVVVLLNSSFPGEFSLIVHGGGRLTVSGGSISAATLGSTYKFEIHGIAAIDNATISDMWGSNTQEKYGIQIYNGNVTINNSIIQRGNRGNVLIMAGSPVLRDNTVRLARYEETSATPVTCYPQPSLEAIGIMVTNNSAPVLTGNTLTTNGDGNNASDLWQRFFAAAGGTTGCPSYFQFYSYFYGYGLVVRSASVEATANTITANSAMMNPYYRSFYVNATYIYLYAQAYNWNGVSGAGVWLASAAGNFTGNLVDRNVYDGVAADGGSIRFDNNSISNHTSTSTYPYAAGLTIYGGMRVTNSTFQSNIYHLAQKGPATGKGEFEGLTLVPYPQGSPNPYPAVLFDDRSAGTLNFYNQSFAGFPSPIAFNTDAGAILNLYNCSINDSQIPSPGGATGQIHIYYQFQLRVKWTNGVPVAGAFAIVTNQATSVIFANVVDAAGQSPLMWLARRSAVYTGSGASSTIDNSVLTIQVYANGTISPAEDYPFNQTILLDVFIPDQLPPTLTVFFPGSGAMFNTSTVRVAGNAFDLGSGMDRVVVSPDNEGTWIASVDPLPAWSVDVALADGLHTLHVRAYDNGGGYSEVNLTAILIDTQPPNLRITQPALPPAGERVVFVNTTAVDLRGTADGDATLILNGVQLNFSGGSFFKQLILQEGSNFYHLTAVDVVGNREQVDFVVVADTLPPAIYVSSPVDNLATNRTLLTVAGVTESDVTLTLNDKLVYVSGGVFSLNYPLSEGLNLLRFNATDRANNRNTLTRTVVFDTVPPDITLTSPVEGSVTSSRDVLVAGSVEASIRTVYLNGAPVPTVNGSFSKLVRLDEGANTFALQAWDPAGNPASVSVHVTLDTVSPTLSLTSPLSGVLVNTTSIRVLGSIEAGALLSINDIEVTGANGDFDERVGLTEGANTIAVGATDAAGNAAAVQIIVYRDTIAPDLTTDLPATPKTTESPVITVTGRAVGAVSLRVNGDVVALDAGGKFTVVVPLELGVNSLTFVATDAAGNSQTVLGVVYRAAPLEAPGGLFGLGDASYALLPLALIIGAVAAYLVVRVRRRAGP